MTALLRIAPEVEQTLHESGPVVALETTLIAHGFPPGVGVEVGLEAEARVRSAGAVAATVGVLDGAVVVGLTTEEIDRFGEAGPEARKTGPRDLAACAIQGAVGATTVGGTLAACRLAGIRFMGTGGIGGVHRGFAERPDVSADLAELARTTALVVSSGVKSLLDVPATAELLETLGVPALGYRTGELPLFYSAGGGPPVSARIESAAEAARIAAAHWELGGGALLLGSPCRRERAERGGADRGGARGRTRPRRRGPGRDAVRALLSARAQRRPGACRQPRPDPRERGPGGRGRRRLRLQR